MKVTKGKATATLTDLKNLIGDVFDLVEKHGEVTITSYNKPKYSIKRIEEEEDTKPDEKTKIDAESRAEFEQNLLEEENPATQAESTIPKPNPSPDPEPSPNPYPSPNPSTYPSPQSLPTSPADNVFPTPVVAEETAKVEAVVTPLVQPKPNKGPVQFTEDIVISANQPENVSLYSPGSEEQVDTPPADNSAILKLFSDLSDAEVWDRSSPKEQNWVQKARNLL